MIHADTHAYNQRQSAADHAICELLAEEIHGVLPDAENKVWHAHPVWFLAGNPIVGYSKIKAGIRLLFWSGRSFETPGLEPVAGFQTAGALYTDVHQVDGALLVRWLQESRHVQWDYKNIVKRKGELVRLTVPPTSL